MLARLRKDHQIKIIAGILMQDMNFFPCQREIKETNMSLQKKCANTNKALFVKQEDNSVRCKTITQGDCF